MHGVPLALGRQRALQPLLRSGGAERERAVDLAIVLLLASEGALQAFLVREKALDLRERATMQLIGGG
jgi:hypothetical protein